MSVVTYSIYNPVTRWLTAHLNSASDLVGLCAASRSASCSASRMTCEKHASLRKLRGTYLFSGCDFSVYSSAPHFDCQTSLTPFLSASWFSIHCHPLRMGNPELPNCRSYTVGWIAALPCERAAAERMLEVKHNWPRDFVQPSTDPLSYSWGSIGDHNVVNVSLKAGIYGIVAAATAATHMLDSFPQIKFGLLVGIGGAIPKFDEDGTSIRDDNIRLGDIVVSSPSGDNGGVIQYDFVKSTRWP